MSRLLLSRTRLLRAAAPLVTVAALAGACGDDGKTGASASDGSTGPTSITATLTNMTTPTTGTATEGVSSGASTDGSGSQTGTSEPTTGAVDSSSGSSGGPKFDLGVVPDAGIGGCGDGDGMPKFSYIWISNSPEGTVSKIKTLSAANCGVYGRIQAVG